MREELKNYGQNRIGAKQKSSTWLSAYSLAFLIVLSEIPYIQRSFGGYLIMIPFMIIFGLSYYKGKIRIDNKDVPFVICVCLYFLIAILYKTIGISSAKYGHDIHTALFFTFFLSIDTLMRMNRRKKLFILRILSLSMFITMLSNVVLYNRIGSYRYFLMNHIETDTNLGNLANTQYSTAVMLMAGILLVCILQDKKTSRRILWIVLFVLCNAFNFVIAQRAINIILSATMYVLIFIFRKENKAYVYLLLTVGLTLFALAMYNYEIVIGFVSKLIGSDRVSYKLSQIAAYLSSGDIQEAGGSLTARYNLYMTSIKTWTSSLRTFFFGAGDHLADNLIIGNHSQFIDVFGQYGLIGGASFLYSIYKTLSKLVQKLPIVRDTPIYRQVIVICAIFIVRGFIGNVVYEHIATRMFVFFPVALSIIYEREEFV